MGRPSRESAGGCSSPGLGQEAQLTFPVAVPLLSPQRWWSPLGEEPQSWGVTLCCVTFIKVTSFTKSQPPHRQHGHEPCCPGWCGDSCVQPGPSLACRPQHRRWPSAPRRGLGGGSGASQSRGHLRLLRFCCIFPGLLCSFPSFSPFFLLFPPPVQHWPCFQPKGGLGNDALRSFPISPACPRARAAWELGSCGAAAGWLVPQGLGRWGCGGWGLGCGRGSGKALRSLLVCLRGCVGCVCNRETERRSEQETSRVTGACSPFPWARSPASLH